MSYKKTNGNKIRYTYNSAIDEYRRIARIAKNIILLDDSDILDSARKLWLNGWLNLGAYSVIGQHFGLPPISHCKTLYEPSGRAREYAALATNPYRGCTHACVYCYAPHIVKMKREAFNEGAVPRKDYLRNLEDDLKRYQAHGIHRQVMLCFTTDAYNADDVEYEITKEAIYLIHRYGLGVCILTKGGKRALRDICMLQGPRDSFAITLTGLSEAMREEYEPNAASNLERIETLANFAKRGVHTWVSLEPLIDIDETIRAIKASVKYTKLYKIGVMNYRPSNVDNVLGVVRIINTLIDYGYMPVDGTQENQEGYYIKDSLKTILINAIGGDIGLSPDFVNKYVIGE